MKKSIIYVDGFNLFFGLLKGTRNKWLNLQEYFERLRTDDDIETIKYFTTFVMGNKRKNQETYIDALSTLPKIEILLGKFKTKNFRCLIECGYSGDKIFKAPIEKRTDVNIATHFLSDAAQRKDIDRLILVSGDSDLIPAIITAKDLSPEKNIIVYVPFDPSSGNGSLKVSSEIRNAADKHSNLPVGLISKSQFEDEIIAADGTRITKPNSW